MTGHVMRSLNMVVQKQERPFFCEISKQKKIVNFKCTNTKEEREGEKEKAEYWKGTKKNTRLGRRTHELACFLKALSSISSLIFFYCANVKSEKYPFDDETKVFVCF